MQADVSLAFSARVARSDDTFTLTSDSGDVYTLSVATPGAAIALASDDHVDVTYEYHFGWTTSQRLLVTRGGALVLYTESPHAHPPDGSPNLSLGEAVCVIPSDCGDSVVYRLKADDAQISHDAVGAVVRDLRVYNLGATRRVRSACEDVFSGDFISTLMVAAK